MVYFSQLLKKNQVLLLGLLVVIIYEKTVKIARKNRRLPVGTPG
jgi:hypothetical protein